MKNICGFICTHEKRSEFLDGFIYHYKRCGINIPLYVFTNDRKYENCDLITYVFDDIIIHDAFTSANSNWGLRLKNSINYLRNLDIEYAIFHPDDGWILNDIINKNRLNIIIDELKSNNIDNYRLSQRIESINNKIINNDIEIIEKRYLPHYLTHQTSIWSLNKLDLITNSNDTSGNHECNGSRRCLDHNFKMCQFIGEPILNSIGINHCTEGYDLNRVKLSTELGFAPKNKIK